MNDQPTSPTRRPRTASVKVGNRRLLRLAKILDTADELHEERGEPTYKQLVFVHPCGTPACALGHWAAANPRRWVLAADSPYLKDNGTRWARESVEREFNPKGGPWNRIFGPSPRPYVRTAKEAAANIRAFVAERGGV